MQHAPGPSNISYYVVIVCNLWVTYVTTHVGFHVPGDIVGIFLDLCCSVAVVPTAALVVWVKVKASDKNKDAKWNV